MRSPPARVGRAHRRGSTAPRARTPRPARPSCRRISSPPAAGAGVSVCGVARCRERCGPPPARSCLVRACSSSAAATISSTPRMLGVGLAAQRLAHDRQRRGARVVGQLLRAALSRTAGRATPAAAAPRPRRPARRARRLFIITSSSIGGHRRRPSSPVAASTAVVAAHDQHPSRRRRARSPVSSA